MAAQALEGGMKPLYQSIIDLSKMLRYSVRIRGRQIPLAVELDYLEAYLKLQKLRYPVGFSYKISMDPELEQAIVPFNFLQPVAENAFTHGFSNEKEKKLMVTIKAGRKQIHFQIWNNGPALEEERYQQIELQIQSGSSHGLSMIYEKLTSAYGDNCVLKLQAGKTGGTMVTIEIPYKNWIDGEEENDD